MNARIIPKGISTYIPTNHYLSLAQAAKILGLKRSGLQHHIKKGNLQTIKIPGLGHIIKENDINNLKPKMRQKNKGNTSYNYLIQADLPGRPCKIGKANRLKPRLSIFGNKLPFEWNLLHSFKSDNSNKSENELHRKYANKKLNGEWFNLSEQDIKDIQDIKYYQNGEFHYV
jgi:hypothetical protein